MGVPEIGTMESELLARCRAYLKAIPESLHYITPAQLAERMRDDPTWAVIIDNRDADSYAKAHIPGAIHVPLRDAADEDNLAKLPRDRRIVVACWVGHTASQLLTVLRLLGYDAIGLKYGMGEPAVPGEPKLGWEETGLPTERELVSE